MGSHVNLTRRKPFYLTSELWMLVAGAAAVLIAAGVAARFAAPEAWTLAAVLGAGYMLSRGSSKAARAGRGSPRPSRDPVPATARAESVDVTAAREELRVDKHTVPRERVRVRKEVVTESVTITVPVRREELRIERIPIDDDEPAPGTVELGGGAPDFEVTLMHEVPIVDKQVVARERVRVRKEVVTEQHTISADLRHEEIDVDQRPPEPDEN